MPTPRAGHGACGVRGHGDYAPVLPGLVVNWCAQYVTMGGRSHVIPGSKTQAITGNPLRRCDGMWTVGRARRVRLCIFAPRDNGRPRPRPLMAGPAPSRSTAGKLGMDQATSD